MAGLQPAEPVLCAGTAGGAGLGGEGQSGAQGTCCLHWGKGKTKGKSWTLPEKGHINKGWRFFSSVQEIE